MVHREESLVGRTIAGKFAIEALIGSGAMGQVYRARQIALEKTVALKVLHPDLAGDETFAARFHREAKAASRLDHPNSMRVLDFGAEPDGMLYIAMEYLDGRSLLRAMDDESPFPVARVVDILMQALGALVVAHDMGVVHRDLKPENIMLLDATDDEGRHVDMVKVCDFGIAKICDRAPEDLGPGSIRGPLTTQGLVVGTPEYMSPEQGKGDPLDARSDLYSVGVMLFQLLTGRLPFQAETALGLVYKQVHDAPPAPSDVQPGVDRYLEKVCLKALAKRPADRYQTAREMRAALRGRYPDASSRFPLALASQPELHRESLEQAETQVLRASGATLEESLGEEASHATPIGTPGGTAALPRLPVAQPNVWVLGGLALLVGAGITAVAVTQWGGRATHDSAASPLALVDASAAVAPAASAATAAPSASSQVTAVVASSRRPVPSASAAAVVAAHATAASPAVAGKPLAPSASAATAGAAEAADAGGFSLETSAATPTVTRATGVAGADVRRALPSWKFTGCYRDALRKATKAVEGHIVLTLTIDGSGTVSRVGARGAGALLSGTGDCMIDALSGVSVNNAPASGGTAEVDVACTPR
jgi:serine/threonine-protein kinase